MSKQNDDLSELREWAKQGEPRAIPSVPAVATKGFVGVIGKPDRGPNPFRVPAEEEALARNAALAAAAAAQDARLHPLAVAVDDALDTLAEAVESYTAAVAVEAKGTDDMERRRWLVRSAQTVRDVACRYPVLAKILGRNITKSKPLAELHPAPAKPIEAERQRGLEDFLRPEKA